MARPEMHYHKVNSEIMDAMTKLRELYIDLSEILDVVLPKSRAASLAHTHLEDSLMRAIQSLALEGEKVEKGA